MYLLIHAETMAKYSLWNVTQKQQGTSSQKALTRQSVCFLSVSLWGRALPATPKGLLSPAVSFLVLLSRSSIRPTLTIWHTKLIFSLLRSSLPKSWGETEEKRYGKSHETLIYALYRKKSITLQSDFTIYCIPNSRCSRFQTIYWRIVAYYL